MLEQPGTQFRIYRSAAVGDDRGGGIGAMMLPGTRIRGVIVDNPSGSWVKLDGIGLGFQPYIAPYTLAWSVSLLPSVTELSATYVDGPTGQSSSNSGAPLVVYLFETQVPSSPGSVFVTPAPTAISSYTALLALPTVASVILRAGVAGSAIRVYSASCSIDPTVAADSNALVKLWDQSGSISLGALAVSSAAPFAALPLPAPVDLPIGQGLQGTYLSCFGRMQLLVSVNFSYV